MKVLTLHQPWASLIAVGAKTLETRSWSTKYRGPLAIHAGKARPTIHSLPGFTDVTGELIAENFPLAWLDLRTHPHPLVPLPLGAVVAVCDLVDVVPMVGPQGDPTLNESSGLWLECQWSPGELTLWSGEADEDVSDQLPYGDFGPGRFAWLLDNVRQVAPVQMKGAQGLRDLPAGVAEQVAP